MLKILLASAVFVAAWWLYSHVVSPPLALGIAVAVAVAELAGSMAHGQGSGLRALIWLGAPVLAWPIAAIGLEWLVPALSQPEAASGAAIVAALTGLAAAGHGSGADSQRNTAVLLAATITLYALARAVTVAPYDPLAIGLACLAVAASAMVSRAVLVLPHEHGRVLTWVATACAVAAVLGATPVLVAFI